MEPQLPNPNTTPENPAFSSRRTPEISFPQKGNETDSGSMGERNERLESREQITGAGRGDTVAFPASPITVPISAPVRGGEDSQALQDDTPMVAGDEDLIEMEWVNKAKKIVNETKNDPYLQEREVSRLQASYLQKRYGKEVKLAKDE